MEFKKDPFYTSTKKLFGVIFLIAVLVGGGYAIYQDPDNTIEVLELWGRMAGVLLGILVVAKTSHKVLDNKESPEGK